MVSATNGKAPDTVAANPSGSGEVLRVNAPAGMPFLDVSLSKDQPQMPGDPATAPHPAPTAPTLPDVSTIGVPAATLLADLQQ